MSAIPLPEGSNAAEMIRRLRAIDAEFFGTLYAAAGTLGDLTVTGTLTGGTFVGGDIYSDNWDGTIPLDLSVRDTGASAGYAQDGSAGSAQFVNIFADAGELRNLSILGTLTMGTGGVIRTAASGQRLELAESFGDRINWYTADASESSPGTIFGSYAGSAGTGRLHLDLHSPQNTTRSTQTRLILKAQSASGASGPEVDIFATGTYNIQPVVRFQDFILRADDGTALFPAFSFNNDTNTGMYRISSDSIAMAAGATAYVGAVNTGTASTSGPFLYNLSTHASHPFLRRSTSTGQVFYDSSTRDIKENIAPLPRLGNIIDRLVPVSYTLIDDPSA
ncbi:hypothetical protein LCGC14_3068550, partial [marine sediment metagenome]